MISGPLEYVSLCDKRDFVNVIKLLIFRWGGYPGSRNQCNHHGLYKREEGGSERVEDMVIGARVWSDVRKEKGDL